MDEGGLRVENVTLIASQVGEQGLRVGNITLIASQVDERSLRVENITLIASLVDERSLRVENITLIASLVDERSLWVENITLIASLASAYKASMCACELSRSYWLLWCVCESSCPVVSADIEPDFKTQLRLLVPLLLSPAHLVVKEINGSKITGRMLVEYFKVSRCILAFVNNDCWMGCSSLSGF